MKQGEPKPHSFCETPEEKCTMNYCDTNGCQNRKRELVEPKEQFKQETLEEVAKNYSKGWGEYDDKKAFIAGAKWQQEQDNNKYSEIELLDLLVGILDANKCFVTFIDIKEWFEQNKNK